MTRIVIVEDEINIRETLKEILEFSGYDVFTASNGKLGYAVILEKEPDLVLCDVNMPELDGFALLELITQKYAREIMPSFLFLTAKVETKEIRYGMNLGADDYILKPFDPVEILKIIQLRINKRKKMLSPLGGKPSANKEGFNKLPIPTEEGLELVPFEQIIHCKAERAYCYFYLINNKKILVSKPMKEFEVTLINNGFFKVHKSSIVNLQFAEKYVRGKGGYLVLSDGSTVVVSTRKKDELMKRLKCE
ncbi:MAG: two-component system LytT family response regulator [Vicingaceae bacterium]|jgi:two-component system LytT family response regulator